MTIFALNMMLNDVNEHDIWLLNDIPIRLVTIFVKLQPGSLCSLSVEHRTMYSALLSGRQFDRRFITVDGNDINLIKGKYEIHPGRDADRHSASYARLLEEWDPL